MKKIPELVLITAVIFVSNGCASTGFLNSTNLTEVELAQENYRIVATGVRGAATAGYLLGVSAALGPEMQTFALVRVSGEGALYGEAMADLWDHFEEDYGDVGNRSLALVNIRYDSDALNLIVYTRPTVYIQADVVEFVE